MITLTVRTYDLWIRLILLDREENKKFFATVDAGIFKCGHLSLLIILDEVFVFDYCSIYTRFRIYPTRGYSRISSLLHLEVNHDKMNDLIVHSFAETTIFAINSIHGMLWQQRSNQSMGRTSSSFVSMTSFSQICGG